MTIEPQKNPPAAEPSWFEKCCLLSGGLWLHSLPKLVLLPLILSPTIGSLLIVATEITGSSSPLFRSMASQMYLDFALLQVFSLCIWAVPLMLPSWAVGAAITMTGTSFLAPVLFAAFTGAFGILHHPLYRWVSFATMMTLVLFARHCYLLGEAYPGYKRMTCGKCGLRQITFGRETCMKCRGPLERVPSDAGNVKRLSLPAKSTPLGEGVRNTGKAWLPAICAASLLVTPWRYVLGTFFAGMLLAYFVFSVVICFGHAFGRRRFGEKAAKQVAYVASLFFVILVLSMSAWQILSPR